MWGTIITLIIIFFLIINKKEVKSEDELTLTCPTIVDLELGNQKNW